MIANYDLVAGQLCDARLIDGTPLAPSELLKIALDANILPALFDTKGQPLWLGHKYRHATAGQRIALTAHNGTAHNGERRASGRGSGTTGGGTVRQPLQR